MEFVQMYLGLPFAMVLLCIFLVPAYRLYRHIVIDAIFGEVGDQLLRFQLGPGGDEFPDNLLIISHLLPPRL